MTTFFRKKIAKKILSVIDVSCNDDALIPSLIKVKHEKCKQPQLVLPLNKFSKVVPEASTDFNNVLRSMRNQGLPTAEGIIDITIEKKAPESFVFTIDKHVFNRIVLQDICVNLEKLSKTSCILQNFPKRNLLFEYRSPTMGNTFALNHLHSLSYYNFMTNISEFMGMNVTRLEQVEDWGPVYGILLAGYQKFGLDDELESNAAQHLSQVLKAVWVKNRNDITFQLSVSNCLEKLKNGDLEMVSLWKRLKDRWMSCNREIFKRLNITFNEIQCDSDFQEDIEKYSEILLQKKIVSLESEASMSINVCSSNEFAHQQFVKDAPGKPLYSLARDIAVSVSRKERFNSDSMYYVGDKKQAEYFNSVFKVLEHLGYSWSSDLNYMALKCLRWPSQNKWTAIPVQSILDKAKTYILQELKSNISLEKHDEIDEVAEKLTLSAIIMNLLKHRRNQEILFNLEQNLQFSKNSALTCQFLHAGLSGLQELSDIKYNFDIDLSPLNEPEAVYLIQHLARFDEIVSKSYTYLEPCFIVQYIDSLCYFADMATSVLKLDLKDDKLRVIKARLLLFHATQKILQLSLKLIGIQSLENV